MENKNIRVRFAPSPTGHLHIGGARTALFNWLYARHTGGTFILRIEDTDRSRSTDEYIESILDGMSWLKLGHDEGPYRQTGRFEVYRGHIEKLISEKKAYYCYCSPDELEARREDAIARGQQPKYDGRCFGLKEPVPGVIPSVRFRMPQHGEVVVDDLIKGKAIFENSRLDDMIIMRSDRTPTYNFCVVVDDVDMKITHVIRGDDHLNNTPKQIHIYRALGYKVPAFAHLPMILGSDKARLSKRHGATSVIAYRDEGYLPDALINYLVRLGWSHGDQEIFTREELIQYFSFENVGKSAAVFNPEKLLWLNAEYIKITPPVELAEMVIPFLIKNGAIKEGQGPDRERMLKAIPHLVERSKTLIELASSLRYFLSDDYNKDKDAEAKFLKPDVKAPLDDLIKELDNLPSINHVSIEASFTSVLAKHNLKLKDLAQPVRVALTGGTTSPGIFDVIDILGKEKTVERLKKAISIVGPSASVGEDNE